jgi:hypothetical protein
MASSRALWVFGVARLISSASINWAKTGPGRKAELAALAIVDRNAGDVGRQQIAGELNARELQTEQAGQRMGQRRLAHTGQILDQQMSAGQQAGQGLADLASPCRK